MKAWRFGRLGDDEMERIHCQFCGALHKPVKGRVPSQSCSACWLEIQIGIARQREFDTENVVKITHFPEKETIQ
jgi:hypothetical protein